jgi:hypothetical protein
MQWLARGHLGRKWAARERERQRRLRRRWWRWLASIFCQALRRELDLWKLGRIAMVPEHHHSRVMHDARQAIAAMCAHAERTRDARVRRVSWAAAGAWGQAAGEAALARLAVKDALALLSLTCSAAASLAGATSDAAVAVAAVELAVANSGAGLVEAAVLADPAERLHQGLGGPYGPRARLPPAERAARGAAADRLRAKCTAVCSKVTSVIMCRASVCRTCHS